MKRSGYLQQRDARTQMLLDVMQRTMKQYMLDTLLITMHEDFGWGYPEPTQAIQPYQYGHPFSKKTLLWERGVQPLEPTNIVEPTATWCPSGSYSHKHGEQHKGMFTTDRAKNRAKTFPGIARAMAEQWGGDVREEA